MRVRDRDEGLNSEMTISVHPSHAASFSVTPALFRGVAEVSLILMAPLDYEYNSRVHLKVFANETQNSDHFAVTDMIIEVINVNDNAPKFQKPLYSVSVPENLTVNSVVTRVRAVDNDEGVFGDVTYSISDSSKKFGIDPESGDIHLLGKLDREDVYKYGILVSAADQGSPPFGATAAVTIHVTDINDNMPQFDLASYAAYVTENEVTQKAIATVRATDADSPEHNGITYDITPTSFSNHFTVTKSTEGLGLVYLKEPIDFELIEDGVIKLQIVAIDSGVPPSNSTVPLVVNVADQNDNKPVFLSDSTLNISVYENLGGGVSIGQVKATDLDEGENGAVRYYIEVGRKEFEKVFRLDEVTGELTVKPGSSPDREIMPYYDVTVVAEDKGNPPLSAKVGVTISVLDVNDNPPKFEQERYTMTLKEGATSRFVTVTATDSDEGENGTVRYSITEGNDGGSFFVHPATGELIAVEPLDYEMSSGSYTLVVMATDQAKEPEQRLFDTCQVVISVIDVNDNSPIFVAAADQPIVYDVTEGVEGPRVDRFTATDADSGRNGFVTYSICNGNDKGLFSISNSEGELRVCAGQVLDRETDRFYNLTLCATDSGQKPRRSKLSVMVRVTDTNDNAPMFVNFKSSVNVSEDARAGDIVAWVLADDPDSADFGKVSYSISAGNEEEMFIMNQWTGVINLAKALDREKQPTYDLEIAAKDNPKSQRDSRVTTQMMKVYVSDVNDETPRFVGKTPFHGQVDENAAPGTIVEILGDPIIAVDEDEGEKAVVTYSIVSDDISFINNYVARHGKSFFQINPESAEISTQAELDRESLASDVVKLVIRASDLEDRHSDVNVLIQISDVNDNAPRFRSGRVKVQVEENILPGHEVSSVLADDSDIGQNEKVTYRIQSGAFDTFTIEPDTGVIRLAPGHFLDRETTSLYSVIVVAYDNGAVTSLSSTCVVTIQVEDVNDCRPMFETVWQEVQVEENSPPKTSVAQVLASDADLSSNLEYSVISFTAMDALERPLVPGSRTKRRSQKSDYDIVKSWFTLNSTSGEITVSTSAQKAQSIDRELCSSAEMVISVRDLASVDEENAVALQPAVVKITIQDENDNSPKFIVTSSNGGVTVIDDDLIIDTTEEAPIGTELLTVKAIDDDIGANAKIVYDIIEGPKVQMRDQDSGTIIAASRIDRESLRHYGTNAWINVTILARDLGVPESRSAKLRVRMRVRDINDNSPVFERRRYKVTLLENSTVGTEVSVVIANDADSGAYGDIIYTLKGGNGKFGIHPVTGSVRLLSPLDREMMSEYTLSVVATDNERGAENDRREARVELVVLILDVNDCQPVFTEPKTPRTYSVEETAVPGSFVAVVSAKDDDDGGSTDITYSLLPSSISKYFDIQESTGHITIKRRLTSLPRHVKAPKLDVIASDSGGLSSNMTIYLDIVDANDHAPLFEEPRKKEISIFEEEPAGLLVGHVLATDSDSGLNGIVRYSFCDGKGLDSFLIDEVTGRIITARRLDREKVSKYSLSVCAYDLGQPSRSSSAPLTVKLLDRNDNKAEFPRSEDVENGEGAWQVMQVREDAKVGQEVGIVTRAVDRDLGENARIYYHLVGVKGTNTLQDMFTVDQESRMIIVKRLLDREKVARYSLIIKATNNGNMLPALPLANRDKKPVAMMKEIASQVKENVTYPAHLLMTSKSSAGNMVLIKKPVMQPPEPLYDPAQDRSLIQVDIEITDVNDEWPKFLRREYDAAVHVKAKSETEIIKVTAVDGDIGVNSIVTYTIVSTVFRYNDGGQGPVFSVFSLGPHDGRIRTARLIDKFVEGYFRLEVEARDSAQHKSMSIVNIYVIENDEKVKFIINNPPDVMTEKKDKFAEVLGNTTKYRVIVDDIQYHTRANGKRNVGQSDVTVRAFDPKTKRQIKSGQIQRKLEENENVLQRLFGEYSIREITPAYGGRLESKESGGMRIVVIVMLIFLIILVLVFCALYCHMQRRYKRKIETLIAGELAQHGVKLTSRDALIPGTNVFSETGTNPMWRDDYFRRLEHKLSEDDMDSPGLSKTPVPLVRKGRKTSDLPDVKPRSRSENDKLKEMSIPRTSTDVWVPHGQKLPVTSESLQMLMKERARKKRLEKKKEKERMQMEEKQATPTTSTEGGLPGRKPSTTCVVHEETKLKEKKVKKAVKQSPVIQRGCRSPELSLHSGGPSEGVVRKESLSLHASEVAEDDDSDATATNVTSSPNSTTSSTPQLASSISSVNLISDL